MNASLTCYTPGRRFPSISVTGSACDLRCMHCYGAYLRGMVPALTPEDLEATAARLSRDGCEGFLLSGGSTRSGEVPLGRFSEAIGRIKESTSLKINAHVGLMGREGLSALVAAGVDAFSVDVYGADSAIKGTLGLEAAAGDYLRVIEDLRDLGAPLVAPHICVGIERGRVVGELRAIDRLAEMRPEVVVVLVFTPTKGTPYATAPPPRREDVIAVIRHALDAMPGTRINLGCMRPRADRALEAAAARAGISGLAVPSNAVKAELARDGYRIVERETCCAFR